ncbi:MAG TPA: prepilin-type N-terminal cleavage/methylation domain-containing protein [Thermoanaerobaculia bacterium]|nr:prepilin-type N-terminal cleavage/methylation domain-containing protein [Thermoanaerobaculia bacterium]
MFRRRKGFALVEMLAVVAIVGLIVAVSVPAFGTIRRKAALRASVHEIRSVIRLGRSRAIARGEHSAIKFRKTGEVWTWALVDDLDGDGVRNDDILAGIDLVIGRYRDVLVASDEVAIALPSFPVRDPDTKKFLPANASPVRFNASTLCSFGPLGGGTSGSIFLTNRWDDVAMVRVSGATGRVRAILYDRGTETWGGL